MFIRAPFYNNFRNDQQIVAQLIDTIKANDQPGLEKKLKSIKNVSGADYYIDINIRDSQKEERLDNFINDRITLLHASAYYDSLECFVYLVEIHHLDIRHFSVKSFLPLHYACYNKSREVASYILEKDPSQVKIPRDNSLFNFTILGGDVIILTELFNKGAEIKKREGDDPLEKSIALDCFEMCEVLLHHYEGASQTTPALIAAEMCNPSLLNFLVRSENDLMYYEDAHESVFTLIFKLSDGIEFKQLIKNWLVRFDDMIIDPPVDPVKNIDGVCHWICKLGDIEIAQLMLRTKEIALNRIGANNHIGTYYLASNKKFKPENIIEILRLLLKKGFDLNFQPNPKFETTLEIFVNSIYSNKNKVIEFLLQNNASPYLLFSKKNNITIYDFVKNSSNKPLIEIFNKYI